MPKSTKTKHQSRTALKIPATEAIKVGASTRATPELRDTKQAKVIALLRRPSGATIAGLVKVTGWQPHTVRGVFSGTLKKKLGLNVRSEKAKTGERVYRIIG